MLFGSQSKAVNIDTSIGGTSVVLEGLNHIEVGSFALGEAILAIELELGGNTGVLTPAVHIKSSLSKNESTSIGETRSGVDASLGVKGVHGSGVGGPGSRSSGIHSTRHLEKTIGGNNTVRTTDLSRATKCMDGVRESINGVGVVEGLGTKSSIKDLGSIKGRAVIDIGIGLHNPDQLLYRMVKVELNLVGRRSDRLITRELELLKEILVGVLSHLTALISVKEDIVDIERSRDKRLLVSSRNRLYTSGRGEIADSPETFTNRTEIKVDLDFVILHIHEIPSLSGYLLAFSYGINRKKTYENIGQGIEFILSLHRS